jgi:hypothetical protein
MKIIPRINEFKIIPKIEEGNYKNPYERKLKWGNHDSEKGNIFESVCYTYSPDVVIKEMNKQIPLLFNHVTFQIMEDGCYYMWVICENQEKNIKQITTFMEKFNYLFKQSGDAGRDNKISLIYIPKYDQETTNFILDNKLTLYHATPYEKINKIMNMGLLPKDRGIGSHRIYFGIDKDQVLTYASNEKFNTGKSGNYLLLSITPSRSKIKNRFYIDQDATDMAVYTYSHVLPKDITIEGVYNKNKEKLNVDTSDIKISNRDSNQLDKDDSKLYRNLTYENKEYFPFKIVPKLPINESQESDGQSILRKFARSITEDEVEANNFVINTRSKYRFLEPLKYKFWKQICRWYADRTLEEASDKERKFIKAMKLLASAHAEEYNNNLNGMNPDDIVERFGVEVKQQSDYERNTMKQRQYSGQSNYNIIPIKTHKEAAQYSKYTTWCITQTSDAYESYTNNDNGMFYFMLENGFENIPKERGDGCPKDAYGMSMIAVCIDEQGELKNSTTRWNHENGGNDTMFTVEELSDLAGINFFTIFKPRFTKEELITKILGEGTPTEDNLIEHNGYFYVKTNNGLLEDNYGMLISFEWVDEYDTENGTRLVRNKINKYGLVDTNFQYILKPLYGQINSLIDGNYQLKYNDKWGIMNPNFQWILKPEYSKIVLNNDGTYSTYDVKGKEGLIDKNFQWLKNPYENQYDYLKPALEEKPSTKKNENRKIKKIIISESQLPVIQKYLFLNNISNIITEHINECINEYDINTYLPLNEHIDKDELHTGGFKLQNLGFIGEMIVKYHISNKVEETVELDTDICIVNENKLYNTFLTIKCSRNNIKNIIDENVKKLFEEHKKLINIEARIPDKIEDILREYRGIAAYDERFTIDELYNLAQSEYQKNYKEGEEKTNFEFYVTKNKSISWIDNLLFKLNVINFDPRMREAGIRAASNAAYNGENSTLKNELLNNVSIRMNIGAQNNIINKGIFYDSIYHEVNHAYEDYKRMMTNGIDNNSYNVYKNKGYFNQTTVNDDISYSFNRIMYVLFTPTEFNAFVGSVYGELRSWNSQDENDLYKTYTYKVYRNLKDCIDIIINAKDDVYINQIIPLFKEVYIEKMKNNFSINSPKLKNPQIIRGYLNKIFNEKIELFCKKIIRSGNVWFAENIKNMRNENINNHIIDETISKMYQMKNNKFLFNEHYGKGSYFVLPEEKIFNENIEYIPKKIIPKLNEFKIVPKLPINESQESDGQSILRKFARSQGASEEEANQFMNDIKTRYRFLEPLKYKFFKQISKWYANKTLKQADELEQKFIKAMKLLSSAHANEYDNQLNNMSPEEITERFMSEVKTQSDQERETMAQRKYSGQTVYNIIPIKTPQEAQPYSSYTSWCITTTPNMYESYTNNSSGMFYFMLKRGYESVPKEEGEGCPKDIYGMSMIAVCINEEGDLVNSTTRWNHDNGGNDNMFNEQELSDLACADFYSIFKPRLTKEEMVNKMIQNGKDVSDTYNFIQYEDGFYIKTNEGLMTDGYDKPIKYSRVYRISDDGLMQVVYKGKSGLMNQNHEWVLKPEYEIIQTVQPNGTRCVRYNNKWGIIDKNCQIILKPEYEELDEWENGMTKIKSNGKYGLMDQNLQWIMNPEYDELLYLNSGNIGVAYNGKCGLMDQNLQWITEPIYENFELLDNGTLRIRIDDDKYKGGYGYGLMNQNNQWILEPEYTFIHLWEDGLIQVQKDYEFAALMNKNFQWVLGFELGYRGIIEINDNLIKIIDGHKEVGLMNKKFQWILEPEYEDMDLCINGTIEVFKNGELFGLMNSNTLQWINLSTQKNENTNIKKIIISESQLPVIQKYLFLNENKTFGKLGVTYDEIVRAIEGYTVADHLYPTGNDDESDDDFLFNTQEEMNETIVSACIMFMSFNNPFMVYRSIFVKSLNEIDWNEPGVSWSFSKDSAIEFGRSEWGGIITEKGNILLSAEIGFDGVDWTETIARYVEEHDDVHAFNTKFRENEVVISNPEHLTDVKVCDTTLNESKGEDRKIKTLFGEIPHHSKNKKTLSITNRIYPFTPVKLKKDPQPDRKWQEKSVNLKNGDQITVWNQILPKGQMIQKLKRVIVNNSTSRYFQISLGNNKYKVIRYSDHWSWYLLPTFQLHDFPGFGDDTYVDLAWGGEHTIGNRGEYNLLLDQSLKNNITKETVFANKKGVDSDNDGNIYLILQKKFLDLFETKFFYGELTVDGTTVKALVENMIKNERVLYG